MNKGDAAAIYRSDNGLPPGAVLSTYHARQFAYTLLSVADAAEYNDLLAGKADPP